MTSELFKSHNTRCDKFGNTEVTQIVTDQSGPRNGNWKGGVSTSFYRYTKAFRTKFPQKLKAQRAVASAVRSGALVRPDDCAHCGDICKPHGHHHDYNKPLDVIWLCRACHLALHANERRRANKHAVSFRVCCQLLGLSTRTGERLLASGRFPIPELPRLTRNHRFSRADITRYLERASSDSRRAFLGRTA